MIKCLPRHTWLQVTAWKYENKMGPKLMTFRCAGLVFWPLGNHAEAKANAPGLPRQTSRPRVKPPEPGAWGLPPDCRAPCACWCPHLPTADRAATAQLPLLPEVQPCHLPSPGVVPLFPLSHFQPGPQGQPCWLESSMFTENLSILPPWTCSILGTLYSALPPSTLFCLAPFPLLQDFIVFSSSFHHPAMEMDPTQVAFCPSSALLTPHSHGLQSKPNATNAAFVSPKDAMEGRQKGGHVGGQSAQFRDDATLIPPRSHLALGFQEDPF